MYSIIRSRAGLVALVFALIRISLVSAAPIPITARQPGLSSTLSSPSNPVQYDARRIATINGQLTRAPVAARALAGKHNSIETDDVQLVRRTSKVKKSLEKIDHAIKHAFQKAGTAIKKVAQKVGAGIKTAAKKVGHFIKTTGAKIVKFGMKIVESVGMAIGHVVSFIPGVGKGLQQVINGVSKLAGKVSNAIHAHLGKKLEKGMEVMGKATKVMGYMPRDLSNEEVF